jgi:uncharacterized membrane protein YgdD (TMEM256/DUF423 family)
MLSTKTLLLCGTLTAALAVVLGAFGAHALRERLPVDQLQVFETGVRYQFFHALGLLVIGILLTIMPHPALQRAGLFLLLGMICFSGSIYLLSTRSLLGIESWRSVLGPITPLGGLFFIIGWVQLAYGIWKNDYWSLH